MATSGAPGRSIGHNLPASLTSFIGRGRERADVQARLTESRLVTLTGVGGCGKTRLAIEVARAVISRYPDGVWFADLAPLADGALVPQTVAAALSVRETPGQSITDSLASALRDRDLLLVLDNCEHLLDACARLVDRLLRVCPSLQVLATSREPLGITGEIAWRVPSLPAPDPRQLPALPELQGNPAVSLLVERARAVQPEFVLTERNAAVVAQVCHHLDGIPLALELAAARVEALSIDQVAARLDQRFRLLTGGSRVALPRQQTLRATLDWSYALLSQLEQRVFDRLAVFAGGWTLDAAESVCSGQGIERDDVLDHVQALVRKSLVIAQLSTAGTQRYRLLETLRQYARERLLASCELERVQARHACHYTSFTLDRKHHHLDWEFQKHLLADYDNLRLALQWLIDRNEVEQAVRLGGLLDEVWAWGGFISEGRAYLETLLALPGASESPRAWARLLWTAGFVDTFAAEYASARARLQQAVDVRRSIGDPDLDHTLSDLGQVAREQGDYEFARRCFEESLALSEAQGNRSWRARTLDRLGTVAQALGEFAVAQSYYLRSVAAARQAGDRTEVAWSLHNLACLALDQGDFTQARDWLRQSLAARREADSIGFVHGLAEAACLAAAEGLATEALRLAGATAALSRRTGILVQNSERGRFERWVETARQAVGQDAAAAAWAEGERMPLDQAIAHALASHTEPDEQTTARSRRDRGADQLTPREREVAALIAQGRSNRQIGEALVITERTVAAHVEHLLGKLGFSSRTQVGVWASEHHLTR